MRLGVLVPEFPTQTHVFVWREIEALQELGEEVHLLSTRRPAERCPHAFGAFAAARTHYLFPPGVGAALDLARRPSSALRAIGYVRDVPGSAAGRARVAALVPSAIELVRHARRLGIAHLHVHSCADAAHVAALARRLGGPPYSLRLHGDLAAYGTGHREKARDAAFVAVAARPLERQVVTQAGVEPRRVFTLPMGVDTSSFRPRGERREGRRLRLITVARLVEGKGHRFALAALRVLRDRGLDLEYEIVGDGPARSIIEREVARRRLGDRVRLAGSLGEDAVRDRLLESDLFVLPSVGLGEASPVSVMEAMACGVPPVVTRIGGTADLVADGTEGLLVGQHDVRGLARAIERLALDGGLRRRAGLAARRHAEREFDSRNRARVLLSAIAELSPIERAA